eukprot:841604-Rhodomonas_salina.2
MYADTRANAFTERERVRRDSLILVRHGSDPEIARACVGRGGGRRKGGRRCARVEEKKDRLGGAGARKKEKSSKRIYPWSGGKGKGNYGRLVGEAIK